MPLYRATTALTGEAAARALRDALDELDPAPLASELHDHDDGSGLWDAGGLFDGPPDVAGLALLARLHGAPDFSVVRVEDRDWVAQVRAELTPVEAGRFVVYGSHDRERVAAQPDRARDRGGAGLRHRAPRHDAGLPASRSTGWCGAGWWRGGSPTSAAGPAYWRWRRPRSGRRTAIAGDIDPLATATARANVAANGLGGPGRLRDRGGLPPPAAAGGRALRPHLRQHPRRRRCGGWRRSWRRTTRRRGWRSCRASWRGRPRAWQPSTAPGATCPRSRSGSGSGSRWCCGGAEAAGAASAASARESSSATSAISPRCRPMSASCWSERWRSAFSVARALRQAAKRVQRALADARRCGTW